MVPLCFTFITIFRAVICGWSCTDNQQYLSAVAVSYVKWRLPSSHILIKNDTSSFAVCRRFLSGVFWRQLFHLLVLIQGVCNFQGAGHLVSPGPRLLQSSAFRVSSCWFEFRGWFLTSQPIFKMPRDSHMDLLCSTPTREETNFICKMVIPMKAWSDVTHCCTQVAVNNTTTIFCVNCLSLLMAIQ